MGRTFFVGGNWKCNGTQASIKDLVDLLNGAEVPGKDVVEVVVAPAFVHIYQTLAALRKDFSVSAQDCYTKGNGAYTGEISADMLVDLGLNWVILGHSERRHVIKESDELTADKVVAALGKGLSVIYCIGEKLEERESGDTVAVCTRQLKSLVGKVSPEDWKRIVVAYEPVWAIGTGKVASPAQAQEVHESVRSWFTTEVNADVATGIRIIYGGSVNAGNCNELAGQADIDGFLVGGASLKPEFIDIIKSATASK
ncbi:hypothetical protein Ndes2526B_g07423 [Nannochloris sp. 'desiccata']|nr:hypothetical protein KSW81_004574 [Chlorella desiccata (nom. nud.)]KAH7618479.1 putative Triosephosphate isomerase, cytosolic [Chlorella desiccata (nom. nud.)]